MSSAPLGAATNGALPRAPSGTSSEASADDEREDVQRGAAIAATSALKNAISPKPAATALANLARLAAEPPAAGALLEAGAVVAVIAAMAAYPSTPVQLRGLSALRAFSVVPTLRSEVLRAGGLDATLALMTRRPALAVQDRGATIIANLAVGCPHRKRRLAREGAVEAVVRAMRAFPCDVQMQVRGALALRNLSHNAQVNQYIAGKAGAIDVVIDALVQLGRAGDLELQYQCVAALESMCTQDRKNRQRVIDRDMLYWPKEYWSGAASAPLVHEAIVRCSSPVDRASPDPKISPVSSNADAAGNEATGAPTIANTSQDPAVPVRKDGASVLKAVLSACRRAPDNRPLLKYALSLLALVARKQTEVQTRLGELNAVEVALATAKRYASDGPLCTRAATLLRTLCLSAPNRARVHPGIGVLIRALDAHGDNPATAREVAAALSNSLFSAPQNRRALLQRGGAGAVVRTLHKCASRDPRAAEACLCMLRNVVDGTHAGAVSVAHDGAVQACRAALDATKSCKEDDDRRVQTQAILLLAEIAKSAPNVLSEMASAEVGDWVENGLAKLDEKKYAEVHTAGDDLLGSLQSPVHFSRTAAADSESDTASTRTLPHSRWHHTKELLSSLSMPLRQSKRSSSSRRRRTTRGTSMTGSASGISDSNGKSEVIFGGRWPLGCA